MEKRRSYASSLELFQYAARLRVADEAFRVFLEKKAFAYEFRRCSFHGGNVALVVLIALLERSARVAFGQTLHFRGCERDKGTGEATKVRGAKTGCPYIPPHIGSQWHPYFHRSNAGYIETVRVRFWDKYLVARSEQGRQFCQYPSVRAKQRTEI